MKKIKQMPVCEVSESKPLGRVHVPSCRAHASQFQLKIKIKQMPVCEVSESKPLGRVHVPSCRVHARAVYRAIQFKNKRIANARFGRVRSQVHR
jgi:hypothetical protein